MQNDDNHSSNAWLNDIQQNDPHKKASYSKNVIAKCHLTNDTWQNDKQKNYPLHKDTLKNATKKNDTQE
jgi:hypothetical protein